MSKSRSMTAVEQYSAEHARAYRNVLRIQEILENLPAPEGHVTINWGHAGSLVELNRQLEHALEFIKSV